MKRILWLHVITLVLAQTPLISQKEDKLRRLIDKLERSLQSSPAANPLSIFEGNELKDYPVCLLPPDTGPCKRVVTKYYFDPAFGKCVPFKYGGCGGNVNNFNTLSFCEWFCKDYTRQVVSSANTTASPLQNAQKPSKCPPVPLGVENLLCTNSCTTDWDCPDGYLCCENGCGKDCMEPALKLKQNPLCPKPNKKGNCVDRCQDDSMCSDDTICCFNGCGMACVVPRVINMEGGIKPGANHEMGVGSSPPWYGIRPVQQHYTQLNIKDFLGDFNNEDHDFARPSADRHPSNYKPSTEIHVFHHNVPYTIHEDYPDLEYDEEEEEDYDYDDDFDANRIAYTYEDDTLENQEEAPLVRLIAPVEKVPLVTKPKKEEQKEKKKTKRRRVLKIRRRGEKQKGKAEGKSDLLEERSDNTPGEKSWEKRMLSIENNKWLRYIEPGEAFLLTDDPEESYEKTDEANSEYSLESPEFVDPRSSPMKKIFQIVEKNSSICLLPPVDTAFQCEALLPRWTYNATTRSCLNFVYGGCGGTENLFQSREECETTCIVCDLPLRTGQCKKRLKRYYFNKELGSCIAFDYSGCDGNGNNFLTLQDCENMCLENKN